MPILRNSGKSGGGGASFRHFALALLLAFVLPSFALAGQTVIIDNGAGDDVYGNGDNTDGTATNSPDSLLDPNGNTVIVNSGTLNGRVSGGYAYNNSGSATSTGNSVFINGGTVNKYVYGGVAFSDSGSATATYNTVTLSGSPVFDLGASTLYGGYAVSNSGDEDQFTGNTLNVWNYSGSTVDAMGNFEFYNFIVPATQTGPVLTAATDVVLGDGAGRASVFMVSTLGGAGSLGVGADIQLIEAVPIQTDGLPYDRATGSHGATLVYDWVLNTTPTEMTATLQSVQADPRAKVLSEGFVSGLALAAQGGDLAAGQGMANAVGAARSGFGTFGALSGASLRHNTGSHADMNSLSLIAGLARGTDTGYGRLTGGLFAEFGTGAYDTFNSFGNASVNGGGDAHHIGGGVLGRMDFAAAGCGKWYAEASARLGAIHNDYSSSDLRDGMGRGAGYDASSLYYSLHAGTGYVRSIGEKASLDFSAKYFWTRQGGDDVTLATGDPVHFDDADSHRLRLGGRYVYALNDRVSPYAGAAYEYEFDGKAGASTYGHAIDAPSLRGGTGMAELGIRYSQPGDRGVSVDVGVQGYIGKREGVTGSLRLGWAF